MPKLIGHLLCLLGFHDFKIIDREFDFGSGDGVETVQCRRCQLIVRRQLASNIKVDKPVTAVTALSLIDCLIWAISQNRLAGSVQVGYLRASKVAPSPLNERSNLNGIPDNWFDYWSRSNRHYYRLIRHEHISLDSQSASNIRSLGQSKDTYQQKRWVFGQLICLFPMFHRDVNPYCH